MAVEQLNPAAEQSAIRPRSEQRFPSYALADSVQVAKLIHESGGGAASPEHLSSYLGYKSTNNGAYLARVGAARAFGLVAKNGNLFVPAPLAHRILSPVYPHDAKQALVEAFLNVPLFKKIYEDFRGRELPPEFGMKNALRHQYGVVPGRLDVAYRMLMESAETACFFETRMGARTHLILPAIQQPAASGQAVTNSQRENTPRPGGGSGSSDGPTDGASSESGAPHVHTTKLPTVAQQGDVRDQYISALIRIFEAKSANNELDEKLMERIERLISEYTKR